MTGTAQRESWLARTSPPVEQVRPDLWSLPVPGAHLRHLADAGSVAVTAAAVGEPDRYASVT